VVTPVFIVLHLMINYRKSISTLSTESLVRWQQQNQINFIKSRRTRWSL